MGNEVVTVCSIRNSRNRRRLGYTVQGKRCCSRTVRTLQPCRNKTVSNPQTCKTVHLRKRSADDKIIVLLQKRQIIHITELHIRIIKEENTGDLGQYPLNIRSAGDCSCRVVRRTQERKLRIRSLRNERIHIHGKVRSPRHIHKTCRRCRCIKAVHGKGRRGNHNLLSGRDKGSDNRFNHAVHTKTRGHHRMIIDIPAQCSDKLLCFRIRIPVRRSKRSFRCLENRRRRRIWIFITTKHGDLGKSRRRRDLSRGLCKDITGLCVKFTAESLFRRTLLLH